MILYIIWFYMYARACAYKIANFAAADTHAEPLRGGENKKEEQIMKKVQRKNKSFFFLATLLITCCALIVSVLSACNRNNDDTPPAQSGDEVGTYYYDYDGDQTREYTLVLAEELRFTFLPDSGANHMGSYTLADGTLTLTDGDWTQTATYDEASESITLTYNSSQMRFIRKTPYTVTFDTAGGDAMDPVTVINGRVPAKPADPSRNGFTFIGWFADSAYTTPYTFGVLPVTANMTLYARWAENSADGKEYAINYDLGYEGADEIADTSTIGGKLYNVPTPEREGYTFEGWWISMENDADRLTYSFEAPAANGNGGTVFTADTTLFALWHADSSSLAAAPAVEVTADAITWNSVSGAAISLLTVIAPDGTALYDQSRMPSTTVSASNIFTDTGVYRIEVTAAGSGGAAVSETAVRYYVNNGLERVSGVKVIEPNTLVYGAVEGAQRYEITIECGNELHSHAAFDNGTSLYYNFANCDMMEGGIRFEIKAYADGFAPSSTTFVFERNLDRVTNLEITDDDIVVWDRVDGAAYYTVVLNGQTYNTTGNSLSLKEMPAGDYEVSVTPVAHGFNSPAASEYAYKKVSPALPSDIRLTGTTLSWTAQSGASYAIVYDGRETPVPANADSIDLDTISGLTWTEAAEYTVQLKVTAGGADAYSDEFTFAYNALEPTLTYNNGTLSWKPVAGAASYTVALNGRTVATIRDGATSYSFDGLDRSGANVMTVTFTDSLGIVSEAAPLTVTAHAVTFNSGDNDSVTVYKAVGDALNAPEAGNITGHEFAAWYNTPAGPESNGAVYNNPFFAGPSELVLYAYYEPKTYTVLYGGDDLGELTSTTVRFGEYDTFDVPENSIGTRVFGGWYSSPYGQGRQLTDTEGNLLAPWNDPTDNVRVYAFWVEAALSYELVQGNYIVSQGSRINATDSVTILPTYNGTPVTELSANAFNGCTTLKTINIPNTIENIPSSAFDGCTSLVSVNIYDANAPYARYVSENGVLYDRGTASASHAMRPVYMPAAMTGSYTIPDGVDVIPRSAFAGSSISRIIIPESVTTIESEAFANCFNLTSVVFSNPTAKGQLTIGSRAFMNCTSLTAITFPSRLTDISLNRINSSITAGSDIDSVDDAISYSDDAFLVDEDAYDAVLTAVNVTDGGAYSSTDGILYKGNTLVYYPAAKPMPENFAIPTSVNTIGEGAFAGTYANGNIVIPSRITSIGDFAFAGSYISSVTFEGDISARAMTIGDYAFLDCSSLETVSFADGSNVTSLGRGAFMSTGNLASITIPATMQYIDDYAFANAQGGYYAKDFEITFATVAAGSQAELEFGTNVFLNLEIDTLTIPSHARITASFFDGLSVGNIVADNNSTLRTEGDALYLMDGENYDTLIKYTGTATEYTILEGTRNIADRVFEGNETITHVVIPASVNSIGSYAFSGAYNLTNIEFTGESSETLTIGDHAFYEMFDDWNEVGLTSVTLPDRPIVIGEYAFASNGMLESIDLGGTTSIGNYAFSDTGAEGDSWSDPPKLSITIPASVTSIGDYAFEGGWDYMIGGVTFEESSQLKTIGAHAFDGSGITSFEVPASVESIGAAAFAGCEDLETLTFAAGDENSPDLVFGDPALSNTTDDDYVSASAYSVVYETGITSINFPDRLTQIGFYALADWDDYYDGVSVTFGENSRLATISEGAFNDSGLTALALPASVTYIGSEAFGSNIETFTIAEGDAELTLADRAFIGLGSSDSPITLNLPARLTTLGNNVFREGFSDGTNFAAVNVTEGGSYASYDGALYTANYEELLYCPAGKTGELKVHADTVRIANEAVYYGNIDSVTFEGDKLLEIGYNAFGQCDELTRIELPDSVTTLGNAVFYASDELTFIKLPANLESFSASMLGCENLQEIDIEGGVNFATDEEGGAIYTADMKQLLYYLPTRTTADYTVPEGVTEISENAFSGNTHLESISLPSTLEIIGESAFMGCSSLETVTFAGGGSELLVINARAFERTSSLERIDLPARLSSIGEQAFYDSAVSTVNFGGNTSNLDSIGASAFEGSMITTVVLPDKVRTIGDRAFANTSALSYVSLNEGLTALGNEVFAYGSEYTTDPTDAATVLETVSLPSTLQTTGNLLFRNAHNLKLITFADNCELENLPSDTFLGCISLESVRLPANLTSIEGRDADGSTTSTNRGLFEGLTSLTSVTFEDGSECVEIGSYAFSGSGLQSFSFPASVTSIGDNAFASTSLVEIVIPKTIASIGANAFSNCAQLSVARVEASITELEMGTFSNCPSLRTVTLPETLTTIASDAFNNSRNIETLTLASGNTSFVVDETSGALYNADKTAMYLLPSTKTFEVPATLTTTDFIAVLNNCAALEEVTVEAGNPAFEAYEGALYTAEGELVFIPEGMTHFTLPADKAALSEDELELLNERTGLTVADVPEESETFNSYGGVIYDADWNPVFIPMGLTEYVIPANVTTLDSELFVSSNITSISFADGRTTVALTLASNLFQGLTTLESVTLPANTVIGDYTFAGCTALTSVTLTAGTSGTIGNYAFSGSPVEKFDLVEGYTSIGNSAFSGTRFTSITLPVSLTAITASTFAGSSVADISIADGNTSFVFEDGMLYNGNKSQVYFISASVKKFTITAEMTDTAILDMIKDAAYLEEVVVEEGNTVFNGSHGAVYDKDWNLLFIPAAMTTFTIPVEVTQLGFAPDEDGSTKYYTDIEDAEAVSPWFNCNVTTIVAEPGAGETLRIDGCEIGYFGDSYYGDGIPAFFGAEHLTSVTLPTDRNVIVGEYAFANVNEDGITADCRNITSIYLGENVTVENYAFADWGEDRYFTTNNEAIYVWFEEGAKPSDWGSWDYNVNDEIIHYGVASNPDAEPAA